jgi:hypothetical protein
MRHFQSFVLLMGSLILPGCGNGPSTVAVTGKVTYQGKPVVDGLINFRANGQPLLGGSTNADGAYEFDLPVATYQVRIETPPKLPQGWKEGDPPPKMGPRQVPEKFGSFSTSGLTATVTDEAGSQEVNFNLP